MKNINVFNLKKNKLNNFIYLKYGTLAMCEKENIEILIDKMKEKHPENTITKEEMKLEIIEYFLTDINKRNNNQVISNLSDNFTNIIVNFLIFLFSKYLSLLLHLPW